MSSGNPLDNPIGFLMGTVPRLSKEVALKVARVPCVHVHVLNDRCVGCGACVKKRFCLVNAISVVDRKAKVDDRRCRGCGRCTHFCPRKALILELRPPAIVQGAIDQVVSVIGAAPR